MIITTKTSRYPKIISPLCLIATPLAVLIFCNILHKSFSSQNFSKAFDFHYLPAVDERVYQKPGDINIGAISFVLRRRSTTPGAGCTKAVRGFPTTVDYTESIAYAVELVNRMPNLLPNVTLGFVQRGTCRTSPQGALATSLAFLPVSERVCNDTECKVQQLLSPDPRWLSNGVIGMITTGFDKLTTMISNLYSIAHIPMVGPSETSDELSNKDNHPYFFRIVPPSEYMVKAMLKLLSNYHWTYVSVVYEIGSYGRQNYETVQRMSGHYGICIATSHMIGTSTNYDEVVANLLKYPRARVVLLFLFSSEFRHLLRAVRGAEKDGHFIYVAGDTIINFTGYYYEGRANDPGIGTFVFNHKYDYVTDYYRHFSEQRTNTTKNPWLAESFKYICGNRVCTSEENMFGQYNYVTSKAPNLRVDAVLTLAHAAHSLLSERCPHARGKEARACITGELLREYLKNATFDGYNGRVEFDENQNVQGKLTVNQFVLQSHNYPFTENLPFRHMETQHVGIYDSSNDTISLLNEQISWDHMNNLERVVPWTNVSLPLGIPESVCSRPCVTGEYKIVKDVPCCWECLRCRNNERLIEGNTSNCEACPSFMWPDKSLDYRECTYITPTYPKFSDIIPVVLVCLSVVSLVLTISTAICYVIYREERVIKASSRELSVIQLFAIFIGYCTVILFQTQPTDLMCGVIFYMFCLSFALLYCPLLVKTIRIVRIFRSGAKNTQPRFISPTSQLLFNNCLVIVQVVLSTLTYFLYEPGARLYQPIWTEELVEISCDLTVPGVISFLGYNILLVIVCSLFAFMVRHLPDNFNESKFISMCVSTTLLIWMSFIPTYFTADRQFIRVFLLSLALLLNHSVALVLLFLPKIYSAIFLTSDSSNTVTKVT